ncbi:DUF2799 domain-containing protein [Cohaesibacter celericrescens]|uniref:DUF2799 domain-containing protein n=1 Tax=Cohaesibacter celericrescens TaxID=2067669 RepID=UPI00356ABB24
MRLFPGFLILSTLLTGCASLTEDECAVGEWARIGANDAAQGLKASRLTDHKKACERYNIEPDQTTYMEGYRRGLVAYCTPTNGFNVGRNGYTYRTICPRDTETDFLSGYKRGTTLHNIETSIAQVRDSLREVRTQIGELRAAPSKENRDARMRLYSEENRLENEEARLGRQRDAALVNADIFLQNINPDI